MSKIQITELNTATDQFNELSHLETGKVVGGGDINNTQTNSAFVGQSSFAGLNLSIVDQANLARNYNDDYSSYSSYRGYGYYPYY